MSICLRCCRKDYSKSKRKCEKCGKSFTKFVVKVRNPISGKWKSKTVHNMKLAQEVEAKFKTEVLEGNLFNKKKTGEICFEHYLEYAKIHKKSWNSDKSRWYRHVNDSDYLTRHVIVKILSKMKKGGYSPCTIHHVLKLIKRVNNWHIQNEKYFQTNPCNTIKLPAYDNKVTNYLDHADIRILKDYVKSWNNVRAGRIILFALYTGRRKGEITSLEWTDVSLVNKTVTCRGTKNGRTLSFPLNNHAFKIIEQACEERISKYVFPSSSGHHYYNGFDLAWKRLKKRVGLSYRFHDLRHYGERYKMVREDRKHAIPGSYPSILSPFYH